MTCKGICIQYKAKKRNGGHYLAGHKRCQVCEIFIKVDGNMCPCCGYRLRLNPRIKKYKERLREQIKTLKCRILFCNNIICAECPDRELCAVHTLVKNTTGEKLLYDF